MHEAGGRRAADSSTHAALLIPIDSHGPELVRAADDQYRCGALADDESADADGRLGHLVQGGNVEGMQLAASLGLAVRCPVGRV